MAVPPGGLPAVHSTGAGALPGKQTFVPQGLLLLRGTQPFPAYCEPP